MGELGPALGWGLAVGASLLAGALAAVTLKLPERVAATLTAFGGGVLFAAVAFELVPEADRETGAALVAGGLLAGTLVYVVADAWLSRTEHAQRHAPLGTRGGFRPTDDDAHRDIRSKEVARGESIAVGIFIDGVPESVALGLTVAEGEIGVALLAGILIGNVVEAYGAAQPIIAGRAQALRRRPAGAIGWRWRSPQRSGYRPQQTPARAGGTAQAVAAGAVLAVVSIAVIPHAFEEVSRLVATATVLGFAGLPADQVRLEAREGRNEAASKPGKR